MKKVCFISLLIVLTLLSWLVAFKVLFALFGTTTSNNLEDYAVRRTEYYASADVLPSLNDLPEYENIYFQYRRHHYLFFTSHTMLLVVTYDQTTYDFEKGKLDESEFLEHPVSDLIPESQFTINSFDFRVLKGSAYNYPKKIEFIATSDEKSSVAYLCFYDFDIDYISGTMADFVRGCYRYDW